MTEESLKKVSGEFDLPNLRLLDLSGKQIDNDGLGSGARLCPNLGERDLSCNGISDAARLRCAKGSASYIICRADTTGLGDKAACKAATAKLGGYTAYSQLLADIMA